MRRRLNSINGEILEEKDFNNLLEAIEQAIKDILGQESNAPVVWVTRSSLRLQMGNGRMAAFDGTEAEMKGLLQFIYFLENMDALGGTNVTDLKRRDPTLFFGKEFKVKEAVRLSLTDSLRPGWRSRYIAAIMLAHGGFDSASITRCLQQEKNAKPQGIVCALKVSHEKGRDFWEVIATQRRECSTQHFPEKRKITKEEDGLIDLKFYILKKGKSMMTMIAKNADSAFKKMTKIDILKNGGEQYITRGCLAIDLEEFPLESGTYAYITN